MESIESAAREAFDAAVAGSRVGVLASPRAKITGEIQKCYSGLKMEERADVDHFRSYLSINLAFPNGGFLKIARDPDTFRGLVLDRVFVPSPCSDREVVTVAPTLVTTGGRVESYPGEPHGTLQTL